MKFKVRDTVRCIQSRDALWSGTDWTNTNDYANGRIGIVKFIKANLIYLEGSGCWYNPENFILYEKAKKIIKQYGIVDFCKKHY